MIPTKTIDAVGADRIAQHAIRFKAHEDYVLDGIDLNDLAALVLRLEHPITDADELRDWLNRISLMLHGASWRIVK
jgi:hypothetical protein